MNLPHPPLTGKKTGRHIGDLYGRITDTIIRQIETADPDSWACPWHRGRGGLPHNALTGRAYRGINTLSLWCGGQTAGYADDRWATYRQWSELGTQVRKGEQGTLVLFFKELSAPSEEEPDRRFVARASSVFNAEHSGSKRTFLSRKAGRAVREYLSRMSVSDGLASMWKAAASN